MVNMNIALPNGSVTLFETEATDDAPAPIIIYTGLTGCTIPFVPVHAYPVAEPFLMVV